MPIKKIAIEQALRFSLGLALLGVCLLPGKPNAAWAAYTIDKVNHIITISPTGSYNQDARNALEFLKTRTDKTTAWAIKFQPGKYYLSLPLYAVGLENVRLVSDPTNPAMLIKGPDFNQSEYIFYTRMSHDIVIRGFEFYGKTNFQNGPTPVWSDQGVFFGSCKNITVDNNRFFNFGNSALRITTSEVDSTTGVNSFNSTVTNNYFNNIYQVTTTSNDKAHGGTHTYRMEKNTFVNLRGSVKFASRTPGASDIHILNNVFNGGDHFGLEVNNYTGMEIRGNNFANIKGVAINIYTAGDSSTIAKGFQWGDNFTIADNIIKNSNRAIRISPTPFFDGTQVIPRQMVIDNNTINAIAEPNREVAAIDILHGKIDGLTITRNKMSNITSQKYIYINPGSTNISQSNNTVDGSVLATDGSNMTADDTNPPATPTNLTGNYNGNLTVMLSWKDNAPNESSEEVWGSLDGKNYSLIARLSPQSTRFQHNLKRKPSAPSVYYAVKAINKNGASQLSTPYKINFSG
jgi:hypothetical protein